jgi:hypothetical protein
VFHSPSPSIAGMVRFAHCFHASHPSEAFILYYRSLSLPVRVRTQTGRPLPKQSLWNFPLARCASWTDSNTRVMPRVPGDASQQSTTFLNVGECFRYVREVYVLTVLRACLWESNKIPRHKQRGIRKASANGLHVAYDSGSFAS